MTRAISRLRVLAILFAVFVLPACGALDSNVVSESGASAAESPQAFMSTMEDATGSPAGIGTSVTSSDVGQGADSSQSGTSFPVNFSAMLAELGDYQEEVNVSFDGRDPAGLPVSFAWRSRRSVMAIPPRTRLDIEGIRGGESYEIQALSLVRDGDIGYLYIPDVGCISGDIGMFQGDISQPFDTMTFLNGLAAGEPVGSSDTDLGVSTVEFPLVEAESPGYSGTWTITGSAHVVEGSDIVTRILVNARGNGDFLGDGRVLNGEFEVVVSITGNESGETIVVPASCLEAFLYPVTPDAYGITAIGDLLSYSSQQSIADLVNFYLTAMSEGGWQFTAEPEVFDDLAIVEFQRGGSAIMVTVEVDPVSGAARVFISP